MTETLESAMADMAPEQRAKIQDMIDKGDIKFIEEREKEPTLSSTELLAMLGMAGGVGGWPIPHYGMKPYKDRLDGVDVDAEYELIKQKRSKLPRSLRDTIVAMKEESDG
jgi:hypothetical protein